MTARTILHVDLDAFFASVLGANGWRETPDGFVSGGWNWSDLMVHVAIGNSIVHGNFPPEVLYFAGLPLTYHWFADFHGAISAVAANVRSSWCSSSSPLLAGTLALVVWSLALLITRTAAWPRSRRSWSARRAGWAGCCRLGSHRRRVFIPSRSPTGRTTTRGPTGGRGSGSLLGLRHGVPPHRATTFGLPGLVAVVLLIVHGLGRRPAAVLSRGSSLRCSPRSSSTSSRRPT